MKTTKKLFVLIQTFIKIVFEQYDILFPCYKENKPLPLLITRRAAVFSKDKDK
ncbi:hypothetical protein BH11BAC3_BH11BAC3_11300 [soil metagenome]